MRKHLITILLSAICLWASAQTKGYQPGSLVKDFSLRNVDQKDVSLNDFKDAKGYVIIFTCNTCPVSQAYEERIIALHDQYAPKGFPVIAINPNDPEVSKGDSFQAMQKRAKDKKYTFAYLSDPGQVVTREFGAERTPHVFLVSRTADGNKVAYVGAIDNDTENTNEEKVKYLDDAIKSLLAGAQPKVASTKAIGCSIKSKK